MGVSLVRMIVIATLDMRTYRAAGQLKIISRIFLTLTWAIFTPKHPLGILDFLLSDRIFSDNMSDGGDQHE